MRRLLTRFNLAVLAALVVLGVVEVLDWRNQRQLEAATDSRKHAHELLIRARTFNERKDQAQSLVREFVLTGTPRFETRAKRLIRDAAGRPRPQR